MLDPRRLLTFGEVARRGSFSRAAEALALTQPAVSQQVAALERQLGVRLLDRGPGGPTVTEAGALLLAHADAVADRLAQGDRQVAELAGADRATLRIGAFPSALASIVHGAIKRLHDERPELVFDVVEGSAQESGAAVAAGDLHLAVCFQDASAPPHRPEGTERHVFGEEPMLAGVALDHPLAARDSIRLAELADATWTAPSREHLIHRTCVAAGFEPHIAYVTRDPLAIAGLIGAGIAVSLVPQLLEGRLPGVALVEVSDHAPRRTLYALTPASGTRPEALAFIAALSDTPAGL